jgi:hypothetical protein
MNYPRTLWSADTQLMLITPAEYETLPDGIVLTDINGKKYTKGKDYVDQDTRGGFLAFGFVATESN